MAGVDFFAFASSSDSLELSSELLESLFLTGVFPVNSLGGGIAALLADIDLLLKVFFSLSDSLELSELLEDSAFFAAFFTGVAFEAVVLGVATFAVFSSSELSESDDELHSFFFAAAGFFAGDLAGVFTVGLSSSEESELLEESFFTVGLAAGDLAGVAVDFFSTLGFSSSESLESVLDDDSGFFCGTSFLAVGVAGFLAAGFSSSELDSELVLEESAFLADVAGFVGVLALAVVSLTFFFFSSSESGESELESDVPESFFAIALGLAFVFGAPF